MNKERTQELPKEIFGRTDELIVASGSRTELSVETQLSVDYWHEITEFIDKNRGSYIFGYLGFDLHHESCRNLSTADYPAAFLFVPQEVKKVENSEKKSGGRFLDPKDYSSPTERNYKEMVQNVLYWIDDDVTKRATVARKIALPQDVSFEDPKLSGPDSSPTTRFFHLKTDDIEIMGESPELLADGTTEVFTTYKLSGTAARADGLEDTKIQEEHANSIKSTVAALSQVGETYQSTTQVLQLSYLTHLLTAIETRPRKGTSIADCLKAALPSGVSPYTEGLKLLTRTEAEGRGAYYGLMGFIDPEGHFEFSQILRTIFREGDKVYAWVGAAITRDSDPDSELLETKIKLAGVPKVRLT